MDNPDELMSTNEVAAMLRIAPSTVVLLRRRNKLPSIRLGRSYFYRRGAVIDFLRASEVINVAN